MMPTEADVVALFERANPVPDPDHIDIVVTADQRLTDAQRDERTPTSIVEGTETSPPEPRRRSWVVPAAAAFVLVVALVAALSVVGRDETEPSDSIPSTIAPATTTTVTDESTKQPSAVDQAVVDAFFTSYNAGDADAVLDMLADDAIVTEFDPEEPYVDWDQRLAWNLAQGEVLTEPTCDLTAEQRAEGVTLFCTYETLDAVVLAVGGEPIPTSTYFTIVDGEFTVVDQRYGFPDFATLGTPFTQWMEQNHPEVTGALFHGWTSRDEAVEHGRLRALWADEWARSLDDPEVEAAAVLEEIPMAPPLPVAADGETQESIVGDISWTRVDGNASSQPRSIDVALDGDYYGSDLDGISWRSSDGTTWTKIDRLDQVHDITEAGGVIWAVRFEPANRMELVSWDGFSFEPVELPPSRAPAVEGLTSSDRRLSLTAFGDQLALVASQAYSVPWTDLLGSGDWLAVPTADSVIEVRNFADGSRVRIDVTVDETEPDRIHLHENGRLVTSIGPWPDIDAESLTRSLDSLSHNELMIGGSNGFERAELPPVDWRLAQVAEIDERLLVLLQRLGPADWEFELWAGGPGVDWARLDLPAPSGEKLDHVAIAADGRSALLTIVSSQPEQVAETWHTSDGATWQVANGGASFGPVQRGDFGWMSENVFEDANSIAVSPDGIVWQEISVALAPPDGAGGRNVSVIGDIIILSRFEDFGERMMWIGRVAPG